MKWREHRESRRHQWHTGPESTYYRARKGGKVYEVSAAWDNWMQRDGPVWWWAHDGHGSNTRHATKEAAMAWCENDAATGAG